MTNKNYDSRLTTLDLEFLGQEAIIKLAFTGAEDEALVDTLVEYSPFFMLVFLNNPKAPVSFVYDFLRLLDTPMGVNSDAVPVYPTVPDMRGPLSRDDLSVDILESLILNTKNQSLRVALLSCPHLRSEFLAQFIQETDNQKEMDAVAMNLNTPYEALMDALERSPSRSLFSVLTNPSLDEFQFTELLYAATLQVGRNISDITPNIFKGISTPSWLLHDFSISTDIKTQCLAAAHKNTHIEDLEYLADAALHGSEQAPDYKTRALLFESLTSNPSLPGRTLRVLHDTFSASGSMHMMTLHENFTEELMDHLLACYEAGHEDLPEYGVTQRLMVTNKNLSPEMLMRVGTPLTDHTVYSILAHESCTEEVSEWLLKRIRSTPEEFHEMAASWLKYEHQFQFYSSTDSMPILKALCVNPNTPSTLLADIAHKHAGEQIGSIALKRGGYSAVLLELGNRVDDSFTPEETLQIWYENRYNTLRFFKPTVMG